MDSRDPVVDKNKEKERKKKKKKKSQTLNNILKKTSLFMFREMRGVFLIEESRVMEHCCFPPGIKIDL